VRVQITKDTGGCKGKKTNERQLLEHVGL
jgi:hypothetical protein